MRLLILACAVALAACFAPDVGDGSFICEVGGQCPPDFSCSPCDNRCYRTPPQVCPPDGALTSDAPLAVDAPIAPDAPLTLDAPHAPDARIVPDAPATTTDAPPASPDARSGAPDAPAAKPDGRPSMPDAPASPPDAPPPPPDAAPSCGDGTCQYWLGENCVTCEQDCFPCHTCTLGVCDNLLNGDTCINCPDACNACSCDGVCQILSDCVRCPRDCPGSCN